MTQVDVSQTGAEVAQSPVEAVRVSQAQAEIARDNTAPLLTMTQAGAEIAFDDPSPILSVLQLVAEVGYRVVYTVDLADGVILSELMTRDNPPAVALAPRGFGLNLYGPERGAGFLVTLPERGYIVEGIPKP